MAASDWDYKLQVIPSGTDSVKIHRNFANIAVLIESLKGVIPFFPESLPDNALLVQDGTTSRKFVDSGVTINKDTQAMAGIGAMTVGGVATFNGTFAGTGFLDEDDFASDAADKAASQQSIKAWADGRFMQDLEDDTSPTLSGDLALGVEGVSARSFNFDSAVGAILTVENEGAGSINVVVDGSIWAKTGLIVTGPALLGDNVTIGDGSATDFWLTFNALANDGKITWDQDPGIFLFDHAIDITGNLTLTGTVDGRNIATDGALLDTALQDVVDDTSPTLGGDLATGGYDIVPGNSGLEIEFDNAATRTLTIWNIGAGFALTRLHGDVEIGDGSATDFTLKFVADNASGIIAWDQDPGVFLFDSPVIVTGLVTGSSGTFNSIQIGVVSGSIGLESGSLAIAAGTGGGDTLNLGRTGSDVVYGTSTSQDGVPHTDLMFDWGTTTKRFGHGFFGHGVRTKSKTTAVDFGAAPTNTELDTEFGTEAVLGDGFIGVIEDDAGGTGEPWICWTVNGQWAYLKGTFA